MVDIARLTAFDPRAPEDERRDAQTELYRAHTPRTLSDLIPSEEIRPVIEFIANDLAEQELRKASNVFQFPGSKKPAGKRGPQSLFIDDMQVLINGEYIERSSAMTFDMLRAMVEQTPLLQAIVMTRIRQVSQFCRVQEGGEGPGFAVKHVELGHELQPDEKESIALLQKFFTNCGWEFKPRRRRSMRRDSFQQFMAKLVRDTLTLDSAAIETEFKRDRSLGIDGLYAIDGATIRLCTEEGYRGDDEIFALQVVQSQIRTTFNRNQLIYEPRNPRTDVLVAGYGLSEVELLIRVVTGWLNAMTYNTRFFDSNSMPKGVLHLSGSYSAPDLDAFKRYWNAMVRGVNNSWAMPVMVAKDPESRAVFEKFGVDVDEMMFARWLTFLTSIACAIFGMDPAEINFDAFSAGPSPLSGNDTQERLTASKDKGLRPLLSYFEGVFSDFVLSEFGEKYVFRWTGIEPEDTEKRHEMRKLVLTMNEGRSQEGYEALEGPLGDAPLNANLLPVWQQIQQAQQPQDFGTPPDDAQPGDGKPGDGTGQDGEPGDQGGDDDGRPGAHGGDGEPGDGDARAGGGDFGRDGAGDFGKAFGLPTIYSLQEQ